MNIKVIRLDGVFTGASIAAERGLVTSVGVITKINAKTIVTEKGTFSPDEASISIAAVPPELLETILYPNNRQYMVSSVEAAANRIANLLPSDALDIVQLIAQIQVARNIDDNPRKDAIEPRAMFMMIGRLLGE